MTENAPATADELWDWLFACVDCEQAHEWRPNGANGGTWAAPDRHAYRMRVHNSGGGVRKLRAQWEARS